jgi:subtilisin family serine protease
MLNTKITVPIKSSAQHIRKLTLIAIISFGTLFSLLLIEKNKMADPYAGPLKEKTFAIARTPIGSVPSVPAVGNMSEELSNTPKGKFIVQLRQKPSLYYRENKKIAEQRRRLRDDHIALKKVFAERLPRMRIDGEFTDVFNGFAVEVSSRKEISELLKIPQVKRVTPVRILRTSLLDSVDLIGASDVWRYYRATGKGISIAILDTGVDITHPDLGGCIGRGCKIAGGYNFIDRRKKPIDDNGHGTSVASVAAGKADYNNNGKRDANEPWGVAPDASIYAYKVCDAFGVCPEDNIIAAMELVVDPNQDGNSEDHVDVVNISLAVDGNPDDPLGEAVDNAVNAGIVVVAAAGNMGPLPASIGSPGVARKAITVGASSKEDEIANFSSRGPVLWNNGLTMNKPDIVAPGVAICAALMSGKQTGRPCVDEKHAELSGTSMAAPHVSGAAALLLEKHPEWLPEEIKKAFMDTAVDLGQSVEEQGAGRINVLPAARLKTPPPLTEIDTYGYVGGVVDILGSASSDTFRDYVLEIGQGINPVGWKTLTSSSSPAKKSVLFSGFDTSLKKDGVYRLRLTMTDASGSHQKLDYFIIDNVSIAFPRNGEMIDSGSLPIIIRGTAQGTNFQRYTIEYGFGANPDRWYTDGITLAGRGLTPVVDGRLGIMNVKKVTQLLGDGEISIRLTTIDTSGRKDEDKVSIYIQNYQSGWPVKIWGSVYASPTVADIDNNGDLELVIGGFYDNTLYVFNHDGGKYPGWPKSLPPGGKILASAAVADIDGDNDLEIFVGSSDGAMYAFHHDGTPVLGWPQQTTWELDGRTFSGEFISSPALGDIDGDGDLEIAAGVFGAPKNRQFYAWHHTGELVEGFPKTITGDFPSFAQSPALADLDNDGKLEIIIGNENADVYVWRYDGTDFPGWPRNVGNRSLHLSSPAVGDIDGDGDLEIVLAAGGGHDDISDKAKVFAWHHDGTPVLGWPQDVATRGAVIYASVTLADVDKDGDLEIAVGDIAGYMYLWHHDGTLMDNWPVRTPTLVNIFGQRAHYAINNQAIVADIDGDNEVEIVVAGDTETSFIDSSVPSSFLMSWNADGSVVAGYPKPIFEQTLRSSTGTVVDLDLDSDLELIIGSEGDKGGMIYVWDKKAPYKPELNEWSQFRANPWHTGVYRDNKVILPAP